MELGLGLYLYLQNEYKEACFIRECSRGWNLPINNVMSCVVAPLHAILLFQKEKLVMADSRAPNKFWLWVTFQWLYIRKGAEQRRLESYNNIERELLLHRANRLFPSG
jgi:hypothetical protein